MSKKTHAPSNCEKVMPFPKQPGKWPFLDDMMAPMHALSLCWLLRKPRAGEVSLSAGMVLDRQFPDPSGVLSAAFDDFEHFLVSAAIPMCGDFVLKLALDRRLGSESYRTEITRDKVVVCAGEPAGIRRALIWMEDEMNRREGPFLPIGVFCRAPIVRRRIQNECINDFTLFRNTGLAGFPDAYLNRLAHQGVNGLLVSLELLYPYRIVPEFERSPDSLFTALRERINRYARYGIKVYLSCIEPRSFPPGSSLPARYADLAGHVNFDGTTSYCTGTELGRRLLARAFERIFKGAPGLGGVSVICVGERRTYCYSASGYKDIAPIPCPRCASRRPQEVLRETLAAIAQGMHRVDPKADLIARPYSSYICWGERLTRQAASSAFPPQVIMTPNFESAGLVRQLGRWQRADDYWLTYPGPSKLFRDCARAARRKGTEVFTRVMIGCSHEMGSLPYLPAPGLVYAKFRAIRQLGVTGILANHISGNDPSIMNKAAGELSFAPFPKNEMKFLESLAGIYWGRHAAKVARIWRQFARALQNMPVNIGFSYYGPLHNGPVWPLYLEPRNQPLAGNWKNEPALGDRIGDCTGFQPLTDIIKLCARLKREWQNALRLLEGLAPAANGYQERLEQIAVARALDCQIESGLNILRFYQLREDLIEGGKISHCIPAMRAIIHRELMVSRKLLNLSRAYPRLGFCPEAMAYKYFPELIRWRMGQLRHELKVAFPRVMRDLKAGRKLSVKSDFIYECRRLPHKPGRDDMPLSGVWSSMSDAPPFYTPKPTERMTYWRAGYDSRLLCFAFVCREPHMRGLIARAPDRGVLAGDDQINIIIQTSQFEPFHRFFVNAKGAREYSYRRGLNVMAYADGREWQRAMRRDCNYQWTVKTFWTAYCWSLIVCIPLRFLHWQGRAQNIYFNLARISGAAQAREISYLKKPAGAFWIERHPADFGQLLFR